MAGALEPRIALGLGGDRDAFYDCLASNRVATASFKSTDDVIWRVV